MLRATLLSLSLFIGAAILVAPSSIHAASKKAKSASARKTSTKKKAAKRPPRQTQPTPERYKQIQQALIDKGFLDGDADGKWDDRSVGALKKFEESQKLNVDGKLDSMSLIALGLGPERTRTGQKTDNPQPINP